MIYKKLLKLQQQKITLIKNADNPYFKSKYVPLNQVLEAVKKPLNDMGVVIIQSSQIDGLKTILFDTEDKTSIESVSPYVAVSDPQKLGGNITYNRRYSLVSLLGLEDEDDDGNLASGNTEPKKEPRKPADLLTQVKKQLATKGVKDKDEALQAVAELGYEWTELEGHTDTEYQVILAKLLGA